MNRRIATSLSLALLAGATALASPVPPAPLSSPFSPSISGVVRSLSNPVPGALVVFYNLAETTLTRSRTAPDGTFVLASAPIGVYDLIAYKRGFLPALVRVWHQNVPERLSAVEIQLASRAPTTGPPATASLWELQDRVPPDVLREIELEESAIEPSAVSSDSVRLNRVIGGEVRTLAGVAATEASLSRASVGVRGGLPNGWLYDLKGDYATLSLDGLQATGTTTGNAAGIVLDVAPSAAQRVQLRTRRHAVSFGEDRTSASLQSHGVHWTRDDESGSVESVGARYIEETNLYRATALGTSFFPLASRTWEVQAKYARPADEDPGMAIAMTYRHREGTVGPSGVGAEGAFFAASPDADLAASASARLSSRSSLEGGMVARYVSGGHGLAPRLVARYELAPDIEVFVRGLYRVAESGMGDGTVMPRVASIEDNGEPAARRSYAAGLEGRVGRETSFRLEGSIQEMDEVVRAFFEGDFLTDFDSIYLLDGNTLRQYQASGRHRLSRAVAGTLGVRYGDIEGGVAPATASSYGISDSSGRFWSARAAIEILPTRTGVAFLVRGVRQKLDSTGAARANDSDKVALSVSQDLSVVGLTPFGSICKLLVALESSRSTASTEREDPPVSSRVLGGVALSF